MKCVIWPALDQWNLTLIEWWTWNIHYLFSLLSFRISPHLALNINFEASSLSIVMQVTILPLVTLSALSINQIHYYCCLAHWWMKICTRLESVTSFFGVRAHLSTHWANTLFLILQILLGFVYALTIGRKFNSTSSGNKFLQWRLVHSLDCIQLSLRHYFLAWYHC